MKVYPVPGGEGLRDPRTRRKIPAEGLEVAADNFWYRRIAHGDVILKSPVQSDAKTYETLHAIDPATWIPEPGRNLDGTISPAPGTLAVADNPAAEATEA